MDGDDMDRTHERHGHPGSLLSAYLDGAVTVRERVEVETHLAGCAECRELARRFVELGHRASELPDRPPARELWPEIAARMGEEAGGTEERGGARQRRYTFSPGQLAAAAVLLLALGAGGGWMVARDRPAAGDRAGDAASAAAPGASTRLARTGTVATAAGTGPALLALERRFTTRLSASTAGLDPALVRELERDLRLIDRALEEARRALAEDPGDPYLRRHVARVRDRKATFLRVALRAVGEAAPAD